MDGPGEARMPSRETLPGMSHVGEPIWFGWQHVSSAGIPKPHLLGVCRPNCFNHGIASRKAGSLPGIEPDESPAGRLEPHQHHVSDSHHEVIAEIVIFFGAFAKAPGIKGERFDRFYRAGSKMPFIGRKEPRPSERITLPNGLNSGCAHSRHKGVEFHFAAPDEIKVIGLFSFVKYLVQRAEFDD
jgi:hypothetical protein